MMTELHGAVPGNSLESPAIKQIMHAGECKKPAYHVLLILMDGDITDKQETITAVVDASSAPYS